MDGTADLVNHHQMRVATFDAVRIARERAKGRRRFPNRNIVRVHFDAERLAKLRRLPRHRLRNVEDDARLLSCRRRGIDFRARLTIGAEHVKRYATRKRRFAVPLRHLVIGATKPSMAGVVDPTEDRRQDENLPGLEK